MLVALGCVSGLLALSLVQFFRLTTDAPVARLEVRQQGDGQFQVRAARLASAKQYVLYGDQWQIDARVVRWKLPALMAGVPPLYRLERLSGRYGDAAREAAATRSVHSLDDWPAPDLELVEEELPELVSVRRCAVRQRRRMPLFDGARYQVFLDPRGALFARPDGPRRRAQAPGLVRLSLPRSPRAGGRPLDVRQQNKWGRVNGDETLTRRNSRISTPTTRVLRSNPCRFPELSGDLRHEATQYLVGRFRQRPGVGHRQSGALGTIDAYISAVNRLPVLSAERETELGRRLRDQEDLSAARELVLSHLRLVVSVARQYLGYGLPHADLIQEGNVGLMKAVKRFDPSAACAWCPSPCTGSRPRSTNTSFATGAWSGRHHQGAAQTVLQPAQHAPGRPDAGPGTGRPYRAGN